MIRVVYDSLEKYYDSLENVGYVKDVDTERLLVLTFIYNILYKDYIGSIARHDYHIIEKAASSIFGKSCIMPYMRYKKIGNLFIGDSNNLSHRLSKTYNYPEELSQVLQDIDTRVSNIRKDTRELAKVKVTKTKDRPIEIEDIPLPFSNIQT